MRVVVADDSLIVRRGLIAVLEAGGVEVVGEADDARSLVASVRATRPNVAIVDIRMPPTHTDEGVRAATELKRFDASLGILLLSQHVDVSLALRILDRGERGIGYLLKDRVADTVELVGALTRVADGGTVVDPYLVQHLVDDSDRRAPLEQLLTLRELRVLGLIAEGMTDRAIATTLLLSSKTVEAHITHIFRKLSIEESPAANRRVRAVLRYLADRAAPTNEGNP